jgi:hypothetical protein
MALETFNNGESLAAVRAKLNAAIEEVNRPPIAARYAFAGNVAETSFASAGAFVKIAGENSGSQADDGLSVSANRVTYTGPGSRRFMIDGVFSVTGGVNNQIVLRVAKSGTTCPLCSVPTTLTTGGRPVLAYTQGYFTLETGDYLEVWAANISGTTSATFAAGSVRVVEIKTPNGVL